MHDNSREAVERRTEARLARLQTELGRMLALLKGHAGVKSVILFGSLARDEGHAYSDLDLVVVQDTPKRFMDRLDELYRLLTPDVATDILVYTPREWNELTTTHAFVRRAHREGKVLYAAEAS
jgi:predicted nucleotidyltransferase